MSAPDVCGERREEKRYVINNVINTDIQNKQRLIITFSISRSWLPVFSEFGQIARREAGSHGRSKMILEALAEYNKHHRLGNNQLLMPSYLGKDNPSPHHVMCNFIKGVSREGQIMCKLKVIEGLWQNGVACYSCKQNRLRGKK